MTEDKMQVNPNSAELEQLASLPGIGLRLAERIVEARPFTSVEEMRRVRGLGRAKLNRMSGLLVINEKEGRELGEPGAEGAPEEPMAEANLAEEVEAAEVEPGESPSAPLRPDAPPEAPSMVRPRVARRREPKVFSRAQTFWLMLGVGVVSVFLSIGMTLAIMAGINNTLDLSRHEAVLALEAEVGDLETGVASLASRLEALDGRLSALEGLSGRMVAVEGQVGVLEEEMDAALGQVEVMQGQVEELGRQTADLARRADILDAFLDGLEELLRGLRGEPLPEQGIEP